MGRELELKFAAADAEVLEKIACDAEVRSLCIGEEILQMETTYFDTPSDLLTSKKQTLRLRRENGKGVVTLKTKGDGLCRGEWEYPAEDLSGAAEKLISLGAPEELREALSEGVTPVCGAAFTRRALLLRFPDGSTAELALDRGELFRKRRLPIFEVETELKSGEEGQMLLFAERLRTRYDLRCEEKSKFVRAAKL